MKIRIVVLGFLALAGVLSFTPLRAPASIDFSGWHMPLPQGTWWVYQSPKDSLWDCSHPNGRTHCDTWWEDTCAVDIWSPDQTQTPILAPARGQVIFARQRSDTAGNTVKIKHDNGVISTFFHMDQISVSENITVEAGTKLGYMGKSGNPAFDVHLHFVLLKGDGSQACESMRGLDGFYPPAPDSNNPNGLTYFTSTNLPIESIDRSDKRIIEPILSPPQLWSPGSGQVFRDVAEVIVHWNPSAYVSQYQVEYRADAVGTRTSGWINGVYYTINPVPPGAYSWRVQARNSRGRVSEWSAPWAFVVEGSSPPIVQPSKPTLASPREGSVLMPSADVTLVWNSAANATQYKVETWGNVVTGCDWQASTTCPIGQLPPGTLRWHAKARNTSGQESDWSDTWSFTIQDAPRIITITPTWTPTPTATPTLTPAASSDHDLQIVSGLSLSTTSPRVGDSVTASFRIRNTSSRAIIIRQLEAGARGPNARSLNWNAPEVDFPAVFALTLQPGQELDYRQTRTFDTPGDYFAEPVWMDAFGAWAGVWSYPRVWFNVGSKPITTVAPPARPNRPTLSSPSNQEFLSNRTDVTLVWNSVANATQYRVETWSSNNRTCEWQNGTSCRITGLSTGSMGWHVKARNANGDESDWSDTWTFVIRPPEPPPSPTGNLAPKARREPDGIASGNAFDGNLSTFWTNGLGHRFNLRLTLVETATVNRIIVWDRPQNSPDNQQINQLIVSLSNGWSKRFDMNSGGPRCIDVTLSSPQMISWVNLKADDASGNNGLSEVEIWASGKTTGLNCSNRGTLP